MGHLSHCLHQIVAILSTTRAVLDLCTHTVYHYQKHLTEGLLLYVQMTTTYLHSLEVKPH